MFYHKTYAHAVFSAALVGVGVLALANHALATIPYGVVPSSPANLGPGLLPPNLVPGKEYSHDIDLDAAAAADPEQVIAWDGVGGVADGLDFSFTRPSYTPDDQIDALAFHGDAYYLNLFNETSHLIFSIDHIGGAAPIGVPVPVPPTPFPVPSAGPLALVNGSVIGGAGELSYELGTAFGALPSTQGLWASQAQINGMPLPIDIDAVELWGPEPGFTADSNKYSLLDDLGPAGGGRVSVWNGTGSGYISHAAVVAAVASLLGPVPTNIQQSIDLDALMVHDIAGTPDVFERDPAGGTALDEIIFSIRQIINPLDASGYYATGSEIFVLDAAGGASFLKHGGHLWDKAYGLSDMAIIVGGGSTGALRVQLDLNALEANVDVPEPASLALLAIGLAALVGTRFRKR